MKPEECRARLLRLLQERSFQYRPEAPFRLAAGGESPYYVDCRPVTHSAEGLALLGELLFEMLKDTDIQAAGGLTMGADPLAHALALVSFQKGKPINAFSVRKLAKEHGTGGRLVGPVFAGQRVVILEDVVTTGSSVLEAVRAAREAGLEVAGVVILVDREEGGREAVARLVPQVTAIFTLEDLKNGK